MNLLYPALLLVLHTLLVAAYLGYRRYGAVSRGEASPEYYEAYLGEEPASLRVIARHFSNLLEVPLLFYVLTVIAVITQLTGALLVLLAWAYVLLRLVHSYIHLGPNVVLWRFRVYALSMLVLLVYLLVIGGALLF
jgi:hypothetical protein